MASRRPRDQLALYCNAWAPPQQLAAEIMAEVRLGSCWRRGSWVSYAKFRCANSVVRSGTSLDCALVPGQQRQLVLEIEIEIEVEIWLVFEGLDHIQGDDLGHCVHEDGAVVERATLDEEADLLDGARGWVDP